MNCCRKLIIVLLLTYSFTILSMPKILDEVIVIVNNSAILQSDINYILNIIKINIKNQKQKIYNENILRHEILDKLIIDKIIIQIAEKMHIQISNKEINMAIINIAEQNGLTVSQLKQRLIMNNINIQNYRNNIRKEIMISKVRNNEILQRIIISPQEVCLLYNILNSQEKKNININYILIPVSKNSIYKKYQLAIDIVSKIKKKINKENDFNKLAIFYSSRFTTLKNGKMNFSKIESLPIILAYLIKYAKNGDIIGPIYSKIGFFILKINNTENINISDFIIKAKVRHIFVKSSSIIDNEQAYIKIKQILHKIKTGQINFTEAIKKYSQDENSLLHGGELNWNMFNIYDPVFYNNLIHLNKGEISQPIHSYLGWHIIQLIEDINKDNKMDIIKQNYIYRLLFNRKFNEESQIWIKELRKSAYIKFFNNINI
ncbi:MAG: peptidylprolyl isomerase SurA [Arsenophonus endosymbiont of Ceratovacuna japonica]